MNGSLNLTPDEKLMGGVAHIFGPLVAIIIWVLQRDKSHFVKFQALQALTFHLFTIVITGMVFFCLFGFIFLGMFWTMFATMEDASSANDFMTIFFLPFIFPFGIFICATPFSLGILVLRLIAGVSVLNGHNYKYPLAGKWLENFLKN